MNFYTYTYLSKEGIPYYVGKGKDKRAYTYEKGHRPPKDRSKVQICHFSDEDTALAFEMYLIDFWGRQDLGTGVLRNRAYGGDKPPSQKGLKRSEESLKRISESQKGKTTSEETRKKLSEAGKGRVFSLEAREKIRDKAIGRKCSEETKKKLSEINLGKKHSPETVQKMSEMRKGKPFPGTINGKHSEETKEKMRGPRGPQKNPRRRKHAG